MKPISPKYIITLSSLILASCAHKAIETKVSDYGWRVEDKGIVTTGMPNYVLSPEAFTAATTAKITRNPASDEQMALELEAEDKKPSLRRLYFRALYQQFSMLKNTSHSKRQLNSCPQFHHDKLIVDESMSKKSTSFGMSTARPGQEELAYYPEWMLPSNKDAKAAPIWSRKGNSNKLMNSALKVHVSKIHQELKVLCEDGSTDSYFRLENMVTYFAGRPQLKEKQGLTAFLKIPVFSTMLLLRSTQEGAKETFTSHDRDLIEKVRGEHFERYIVELRKKRFNQTTGAL